MNKQRTTRRVRRSYAKQKPRSGRQVWTRGRLKQELKQAFRAPEPERAQKFWNTLHGGVVSISLPQFFRIQAGYIRKWIWLLALAFFGAELWIGIALGDRAMAIISASMPFPALLLLTENVRSVKYGMEELEFVTRFSLKSVLFARVGMLALFHIVLFSMLLVWSAKGSTFGIVLGGLYMLVPYFVTICLGIILLRRFHNREIGYCCTGVSVLVSAAVAYMWSVKEVFCSVRAVKWWVLALLLALTVIVKAGCRFCRENEVLKMED